jgi:hypothetical protein
MPMNLSLTSPTLPSLLWMLLAELERTYNDIGAARDGIPSVDLWANLLRCLDETGTERGALPALVRLSRRAVRARVAFAVRHGWVEEEKTDSGRTVVLLTVRGAAVASRWKLLQAAAEEQARARIDIELTGRLRTALETVAVKLPLEHPHYPASYGAADASITGGPGQDWKAVPRDPDGSVSNLSLLALVSQVLVAFAIAYEKMSPVALSLSASVIKRIPPEGRLVRGLGNSAHISALTRHGFVCVSANDGEKVIRLTEKGAAVRDAYDERIAAVENEWCNQFGEHIVTELRLALRDVAKQMDSNPRPVLTTP